MLAIVIGWLIHEFQGSSDCESRCVVVLCQIAVPDDWSARPESMSRSACE
jgi:hypothetical protein